MNNVHILQNILTEQVIATDLLFSAKSGIRNYANALTETHSQEVRNVLKKQLLNAISFHEQIANYMISNGYYNVNDINEQITIDINNAEKTLNMDIGS